MSFEPTESEPKADSENRDTNRAPDPSTRTPAGAEANLVSLGSSDETAKENYGDS